MIVRTRLPILAHSVLFVVVTGAALETLSPVERAAVVAHERAHWDLGHTFERVLGLLTFKWRHPGWFRRICHRQEYDADLTAAMRGHASGLLSVLRRVRADGDVLHPPPRDRIAILEAFQNGK